MYAKIRGVVDATHERVWGVVFYQLQKLAFPETAGEGGFGGGSAPPKSTTVFKTIISKMSK